MTPDEMIHISIHPDDMQYLSDEIKNFITAHENISFYKDKPDLDKVKEFLKITIALKQHISKNKNEETNVEGIMFDQLIELMNRMNLQDLRQILSRIYHET